MPELARPSLIANLGDECDMVILNVNDAPALRTLAQVLAGKAKAAKAKADDLEAGRG